MTTLRNLQELLTAYLQNQGITAQSAWPREDKHLLTEPLVLVKVKEVEALPVGLQHYLGDVVDSSSGRAREVYGRRANVRYALELYSPVQSGEEGCRMLLDQVAGALQVGSPAGLTLDGWSMGETAFQKASGMFYGRLLVQGRCLLVAETDETGAFLGFEVKGAIEVCLS